VGQSERVRILHHEREVLVVIDIARNVVVVLQPLLHRNTPVLRLLSMHHHIVSFESVKELAQNLVFCSPARHHVGVFLRVVLTLDVRQVNNSVICEV